MFIFISHTHTILGLQLPLPLLWFAISDVELEHSDAMHGMSILFFLSFLSNSKIVFG